MATKKTTTAKTVAKPAPKKAEPKATKATTPAKAAPKTSDKINTSKAAASGGDFIVVTAPGHEPIRIHRTKLTGQAEKLARVGASYAALADYLKSHKPEAKLATGITGRDAPHASKAIADSKKPATAQAAERTAKAAKGARAATGDDSRKITKVQPNPKKPGSASHARYAKYKVGMTVTQALAAGLTRGDISWDSERGFISF